ncbi:hypothetical protein PC128_g8835 [Phytophthora cactorum]|nr:hypothetical protein PC128_g8835 [Phytophthora cactorum]
MSTKDDGLCAGCIKGKHSVTSFSKSTKKMKTTQVLELVHSALMGPIKTLSNGGSKNVLLFVYDFSRYIVGFFLKKKSKVVSYFSKSRVLVENQLGQHIRTIRTDSDAESGLAERTNRTVMEMARAMLHPTCVSY